MIDLVRNFLLLRDIFGYLLPGIVFLLLGMLTGRFLIPDWLAILDLSFWQRVFVFLIMALVAGHVLVAISYLPANLKQLGEARKNSRRVLPNSPVTRSKAAQDSPVFSWNTIGARRSLLWCRASRSRSY